ncbi:MAG: hypothetical protein PWQ37_1969 [Candidatus Petromonas sp.]|jgi:hypothetical protein|nr:hypothetical protein [Candidatus Petromonas sp.]
MKKILVIVLVIVVIGASVPAVVKYFNKTEKDKEISIENKVVEAEQMEKLEEKDSEEADLEQFIRSDSQGFVDVGVLFKNLVEENKDYLIFEMMLNTHSVELDGLDYAAMANLKNDKGLVVSEGFEWKKTEGSGHHIFGYLRVPKKYKGKYIVDDTTKFIELELKGLDSIDSRKFIWKENALQNLKK